MLSVLLVSAVGTPARAAWPHNPGTNLPLSTAANEQSTGAMVSDGAGGAFVAWQDFRNGATYDIYAQHILVSGTVDPAWPANGLVICNATNSQSFPAICSDGASGAIIAWHDVRGGATFDIYAQHVFASGSVDPMWPVNGRAICSAASNQVYPQMVPDGSGGAVITWMDQRSGLAYDVYAQHVLPYGAVDPAWPVDGRALCTATDTQTFPKLCSDLAGGAIVVWNDNRAAGVTDIYATHVQAGGTLDPLWPVDGKAMCTATNTQQNPAIETDGSGGAVIAWEDYRSGVADLYVTHVYANGTLHFASQGIGLSLAANSQINPAIVRDAGQGVIIVWQDNRTGGVYDIYAHHFLPGSGTDGSWPADGRAVCTAAGDQQFPMPVSDGAGGAIIAWQDSRTQAGIYAQHLLAAGTVDPNWPVDGRALTIASNNGTAPRGVSDGAGGLIAAWNDSRSGNADMFAQRVARFGYLGTPEAEIASVTDVPNDQGGRVKVSFNASWLDTESDPNLGLYEVWRSVPGSLATAAIRAGAHQAAGFAERPSANGSTYVAAANGYWEYLGSQNAVHYISNYAYLASTTGDSVGGYNPKTAFMVVARNGSGSMYWLSTPASGYSVDNVAPAAPMPFSGQYAGGTAHLHWNPNTEPDVAGYRLYRGATSGFTPGPGTLVASPSDTGYADVAGAPYYYKLSAVDVHGNQSAFTTLLPSGTVGVEGGASLALALARPSPNPALESVALGWTLPRAMHASLAVFDASGRRLRQLADGTMSAGAHSLRWDLTGDDGAPVASGLCFVRLSAGGRVLVQRLATVR